MPPRRRSPRKAWKRLETIDLSWVETTGDRRAPAAAKTESAPTRIAYFNALWTAALAEVAHREHQSVATLAGLDDSLADMLPARRKAPIGLSPRASRL